MNGKTTLLNNNQIDTSASMIYLSQLHIAHKFKTIEIVQAWLSNVHGLKLLNVSVNTFLL